MAHLIDPLLWDDPDFIRLSDLARTLYLAMLCGPNRNKIPGLFRGSVITLSETLARPQSSVERALTELEAEPRLCFYDRSRKVIALPKGPEHSNSASPNPNQLKSWWYDWKQLPKCDIKVAHLRPLIKIVNLGAKSVVAVWRETFATAIDWDWQKEIPANSDPKSGQIVQFPTGRPVNPRRISRQPPSSIPARPKPDAPADPKRDDLPF